MATYVVPRTDVAVEVTGADRLRYLDDVTTQQLADRPARTATSALELDPHGAPRAAFDVVVLEDRVILLAPTAPVATDLVERLGARTFLSDATFAASQLVVVSVRGDQGRAVAADAGLDVAAGRVDPRVGAIVVGWPDGVDVLVELPDVDVVVDTLVDAGARRGSDDDLARWQVAAGVPRWGHELAPPHLPEELGLLASHVHLAKGCYPGQEAVARMWMLGRPRRQLARVRVEGDVAPGWRAGEGRRATEVTATVRWEGELLGLAFVPPDLDRGSRVEADGGAVEVIEFVGAGRPVPGHDPNVRRRRDQRS